MESEVGEECRLAVACWGGDDNEATLKARMQPVYQLGAMDLAPIEGRGRDGVFDGWV